MIHMLTYYDICVHTCLHTTVYVCAWIHTSWNIVKQLLNSKRDTELPDIFLIDGFEIKDALFIAKTFNSYFTNLGPTLTENNPHCPKLYDTFMPHPPSCSFGLLPASSLEIIQISSLLKNSASSRN